MPTYTFKNTDTGETRTDVLTIAGRETFLTENPGWVQVPSAPLLVSGVRGLSRLNSEGWKDTLREMKKTAGRGNTINV